MLKRLFISLIILSALTAEGIINTPWNIYSLCLFVNNVSSLVDGTGYNVGFAGLNNTGKEKFLNLVSENRLLTESSRIEKIKYDLPVRPLLRDSSSGLRDEKAFNGYRHDLSCSLIDYLPVSNSKIEKEILIKISDTSPPVYSL